MPARRPKKRRDDSRSDREDKSSKLNEIVDVMKTSASHLVGTSQAVSLDQQEQERVSFFQWMFESTRRMHVGSGGNSKPKHSIWPCISQQQSLRKATPRDHGYRRGLLPLHRTLIKLNTQWTPPQDQRLPLLVASWSCYMHSLLKWWATFFCPFVNALM